jgi:hypothetical protein
MLLQKLGEDFLSYYYDYIHYISAAYTHIRLFHVYRIYLASIYAKRIDSKLLASTKSNFFKYFVFLFKCNFICRPDSLSSGYREPS